MSEKVLSAAHKALERGGYETVMMLVKKRITRAAVQRAREALQEADRLLQEIIAPKHRPEITSASPHPRSAESNHGTQARLL